MKLKLPLILITTFAIGLCSFQNATAQNSFPGPVSIGTTVPNSSSILELKSTSKGFLLPRMTSTQRAAIISPSKGLIIYQTDGSAGLYYFDKDWQYIDPTNTSRALANLTATSINKSLIPASSGKIDLGSSTNNWRNLFLTGALTTRTLHVTSGGMFLNKASDVPWERPLYHGARSRGTLAEPMVVAKDDILTSILVAGYDGTGYQQPAGIEFWVDSTPTLGRVPGRITFTTGSNARNRKVRMTIASNGDFNFNDGQINLQQSTGDVAIGTSASQNDTKLMVANENNTFGLVVNNNPSGSGYNLAQDRYGLKSQSIGLPGYGVGGYLLGGSHGLMAYATGGNAGHSDRGIGVKAIAQSGNFSEPSGDYIGVQGRGMGGANNYGVYGYTYDPFESAFNAAGYFSGDVYANDFYSTSDRKFKTDITLLENSLKKLMMLKPSSYLFSRSEKLKSMGLPAGNQLGLIADEVKQVLPELVKAAVKPADYDKDRKQISAEVKYETVNYIGIIPVLVASVQEQQKQIEQQQAQIEELKAMIQTLTKQGSNSIALSNAYIKQNVPNPGKHNTSISYYVPTNSTSAQIMITDVKGARIKTFTAAKGEGKIDIRTGELTSGTYNYTLFVNGSKVDTKQMIIIK
jgi:hypothetical protein